MPINNIFLSVSELPETIPLFPLPATVLFARGDITLNVFEPRYIQLIDDVLRSNRLIGIIQPSPGSEDTPLPELERVGCLGRVTALQETGEGNYLISLTGICRFRIVDELYVHTPFRQVTAAWQEFSEDLIANAGADKVDRPRVMATLKDFLEASELEADWAGIRKASNEALVNALCMMSPYETREKQALLEAPDLQQRAEMLIAITEMELAKGNASDNTVQ